MTELDWPTLEVERFHGGNQGINATLLLEFARVALRGSDRISPVAIEVRRSGRPRNARVSFDIPDPRSAGTLQPNEFVEKGAIVLAGLVLNWLESLQITHVVEVGSRVDYFIGLEPGDRREVLEVSGTWDEDLDVRLKKKHAQLEESPWVRAPYKKKGWVSVTRFADPAVTVLENGGLHD
jgi:hypothetical protein